MGGPQWGILLNLTPVGTPLGIFKGMVHHLKDGMRTYVRTLMRMVRTPKCPRKAFACRYHHPHLGNPRDVGAPQSSTEPHLGNPHVMLVCPTIIHRRNHIMLFKVIHAIHMATPCGDPRKHWSADFSTSVEIPTVVLRTVLCRNHNQPKPNTGARCGGNPKKGFNPRTMKTIRFSDTRRSF